MNLDQLSHDELQELSVNAQRLEVLSNSARLYKLTQHLERATEGSQTSTSLPRALPAELREVQAAFNHAGNPKVVTNSLEVLHLIDPANTTYVSFSRMAEHNNLGFEQFVDLLAKFGEDTPYQEKLHALIEGVSKRLSSPPKETPPPPVPQPPPPIPPPPPQNIPPIENIPTTQPKIPDTPPPKKPLPRKPQPPQQDQTIERVQTVQRQIGPLRRPVISSTTRLSSSMENRLNQVENSFARARPFLRRRQLTPTPVVRRQTSVSPSPTPNREGGRSSGGGLPNLSPLGGAIGNALKTPLSTAAIGTNRLSNNLGGGLADFGKNLLGGLGGFLPQGGGGDGRGRGNGRGGGRRRPPQGRGNLPSPGGFLKKRALLLLLLLLIGGVIIMSLFGLFGGGNEKEYKVVLNKASLSGPKVENGKNISFSITVQMTGPGNTDIEVTDPLPPKTQFVSTNEGGKLQGNQVVWNLKNIAPNQIVNLQLVLKPEADAKDFWVTNKAFARIAKKSSLALGTLSKSGDRDVQNGQEVNYQLTVTYTGSGTSTITVTDPIPQNAEYIPDSASDNGVLQNNILTWNLTNIAASIPKTLTFKVKPLKEDVYLQNQAEAKISGLSSGTGPITGGTSGPANGEEQDKQLQALIGGQGRNVTVIGDEDSFVAKVLQNGASLGISSKDETYLRQIYQASAAFNVNPIIVFGTWGTEVGFQDDPGHLAVAFSCPPRSPDGFASQVRCSAKTYDFWMKDFEQKNKEGQAKIDSLIGKNCVYNDPMIYAIEMYGPICHAEDDNANYRPNMIRFYKKIIGQ